MPRWQRGGGRYGAAASFVYRAFDAASKVAPRRSEIRGLRATHPDACLQTFFKHGYARWREMKWLGSYRFATLNVGGRDREDLLRLHDSIRANLSFEPVVKPVFGGALNALRSGR